MIDTIWQMLLEQLRQNQFLQGGAVLALLGSVAYRLRAVPAQGWSTLRRLFLVEADIQQDSTAFEAFIGWLADHPYGRRVRRFTVATTEQGHHGDRKVEVVLSPAPGRYVIWRRGRPVLVTRDRDERKSDDLFVAFRESITLQTFGRDRGVLQRMIEESIVHHEEKRRRGQRVLVMDGFGGWDSMRSASFRPLDSVVLPDGVLEGLVSDLEAFIGGHDRYIALGVPYRRGYLFDGPPGTGKTSVCIALAGHFRLDVAVASLADEKLTDADLARTLAKAPGNAVLLIEDLDCLYGAGRERKDAGGVTLSGFLNVLDGAMSHEGRIAFMTTNHPDRLDPALLRPGRTDVRTTLGLATDDQIVRMYRRFFAHAGDQEAGKFLASWSGQRPTTAAVQQRLMREVEVRRD